MKNIYETLIVFKPDVSAETKAKYIDLFTHISGKKRGIKLDDKGVKGLAYKIKDIYEKGYFVLYTWKGTTENVAEAEIQMRIDDDVIKFMTVKLDEDRLLEEGYNGNDFAEEAEVAGNVESEQESLDAWDKIFNC